MRKTHYLVLVLAALAFRLQIWGLALTHRHEKDWGYYYGVGIVSGMIQADSHRYLMYGDVMGNDVSGVTLLKTPGYPALLELLQAPEARWGVTGAVFLQLLMDATILLLVMRWAMQGAGRWGALVAGLFYASSPVAACTSLRIASGTLFALLLTASLMILKKAWGHDGPNRWILGLLLLVLACYVAPSGLVVAGVLLVLLAGSLLRPHARRWAMKHLAVTAACLAIGLGPWVLRNALTFGYWGFSAATTSQLAGSEAPATWVQAGLDAEDLPASPVSLRPPQEGAFVDRLSQARHWALGVISSHPAHWAQVHLRGMMRTLWPGWEECRLLIQGTGTWEPSGLFEAIRAILLIRFVAQCALVALGIVCLLRLSMPAGRWLILLSAMGLLLLQGPSATACDRIPLSPLLAVVAGIGLARSVHRLRRNPSA
jgi:hypothetical protein